MLFLFHFMGLFNVVSFQTIQNQVLQQGCPTSEQPGQHITQGLGPGCMPRGLRAMGTTQAPHHHCCMQPPNHLSNITPSAPTTRQAVLPAPPTLCEKHKLPATLHEPPCWHWPQHTDNTFTMPLPKLAPETAFTAAGVAVRAMEQQQLGGSPGAAC